MPDGQNIQSLQFADLEDRFGRDSAYVILRMIERFEGVREEWVANLSREDRLKNVFRLMAANVLYQTKH